MSGRERFWLCGARECSMISTIVKPLSAQSVLLCKPARMRVALSATAGILSALVPLLIKETVFLLSEYPSGKSSPASAHLPSWIVWGSRLLITSGSFRFCAAVLDALSLAVILRYMCCYRVEPTIPRVRRVRQNHSESVRTERNHIAQSRISDRRLVSRSCWLV